MSSEYEDSILAYDYRLGVTRADVMHFLSDASIAVLRTLRAWVRLTFTFLIANFCMESCVLLNKSHLILLPILYYTHNSSSHIKLISI